MEKGFEVSPTVNPCTKGLWMMKNPVYVKENTKGMLPQDFQWETEPSEGTIPVFIVDTEGLGAMDEDSNHDTKIFLLAILLSSLLVFNSVGTIDEGALNNLSLVVNLSKTIQVRNSGGDVDPDELADYFPGFFWVLRDFALKLEDETGNDITSKQYLEMGLKEQRGSSDAVEKKNRVR